MRKLRVGQGRDCKLQEDRVRAVMLARMFHYPRPGKAVVQHRDQDRHQPDPEQHQPNPADPQLK